MTSAPAESSTPNTTSPAQTITILSANDAAQILRLATGIQLAGMVERKLAEKEIELAAQQQQQQQQFIITVSTNIGVQEARDYTLVNQAVILCAQDNSAEIKPYVPRNSFAYQCMVDSTTPKVYVETKLQAEARQAIANAMAALQEVDWAKLEKDLNEKNIALSADQIRQELHKAFMEITWKRISEGSINTAEDVRAMYAKAQAEWQKKLENFQRDRAKKRAEQECIRKQIVEERLMENAKPQLKKAIQNKTIDI
jgi:hypothetical protein